LAPRANACAIPGDDGRMSCPTTTRSPPVTATKAAPTRSASTSSIWSGTVPRTSYALKTARRFSPSVVAMWEA
jgi:hypothetical protein